MTEPLETKERRTVEELGAEGELRALFAAMTDLVFVIDREGRYLDVPQTRASARAYLRPGPDVATGETVREVLVGRNLRDLLPRAEGEAFMQKVAESLRTGETVVHEYVLRIEEAETCFSASISPFTEDAVVVVSRDFTESKRVEQALKSWQARHLALINSVGAIVWEASADFRLGFTFVSDQAERLLGYPVDRWLSEPTFWADHIHPDDRDWCVNLCLTETAAGRDHSFEYRMIAADGRAVWLRDMVNVVVEDGRPVSLRGVMIDITQLKQAFDQLSEQELEYRSIFESTSDGLVINDLETGVILAANPAFCRMHGYEDMAGVHPTEHIHPNSHHLFRDYVETVRRGGEFRCRAQDIHRDGSVFDVEVLGRGFTYRGRPAVLGVVRDITEQLRGEQQYKLIFESTTNSLLIHSPDDLQVLDANPAASAMFGYAREELIGMSPAALISDFDPDFPNAVRDGRPRRTRAVGRRKDGSTFDLEATGVPFLFRGRTHLLCVQQDVTEQVRAYQLLEQRVEERTREIERRRAVAEGLRDLVAVVNSGRSLDEMLSEVVVQCRRLLQSDASSILLPEGPSQDILVTRASSGLRDEHALARLPVHSTAAGFAFLEKRPAAVPDVPGAYAAPPSGDRLRPAVEESGTHVRVVYLPPPAQEQAETQRSFAATYGGFLAVPLKSKDKVYGALTLNYHQPRRFSDEDIELAIAFADQASIAIENARLHEQAEERTREIERRRRVAEGLRELVAVVNSGRSLDEILQIVVEQCRQLLQAKASSIHMPAGDGEHMSVRASSGLAEDLTRLRLQVGRSAVGLAFSKNRPVAVADIQKAAAGPRPGRESPEFEEAGNYLRVLRLRLPEGPLDQQGRFEPSYRGFLAIPLAFRDQVYGVLTVNYDEPREFTEEDTSLAMALADQAALAIENARLHEQAAERTRELQSLLGVSGAMTATLDLRQLARVVLEKLQQVVEYKAASLILIEGEDLVVHDLVVPGLDYEGPSATGVRFPRSQATNAFQTADRPPSLAYPCIHVAAFPHFWELMDNGQPVIVGDALTSDDELTSSYRAAMRDEVPAAEFMRSWMAVPLALRDRVIGYVGMSSDKPFYFTEKHARLAQAFADHASVAIENARLYEQAQQAAAVEERQRLARELHDAVTQTLFSTSLIAEVVPDLWEAKPELARERLDDLRRLTRGALAEMRTLLVELRPGALTELPLGDLLRQLGEATAGRTSLRIDLQLEAEQRRSLPPEVQVALYRIAQESINNIVRHANANAVRIELRFGLQGEVTMRISDDGRGFDAGSIPGGHLGVGIMRERAESIGATMSLTSRPGLGTTSSSRGRKRKRMAPQAEPATERIGVLIVDDHEIVRKGLATFLEVSDDIELVGQAASGDEALRLCAQHKPDVVLLDMVMPGMDGPTTAKAIREAHPEIRVLALTSFPEEDLIQRALEAGVLGYLLKNVGASELAGAIRSAKAGRATLAPEATLTLMQRASRPAPPGHDLSPRERQVLKLMTQGKSNRQIAETLVISQSTADFHVSNILGKLGAASRTEAVAIALQNRLVD